MLGKLPLSSPVSAISCATTPYCFPTLQLQLQLQPDCEALNADLRRGSSLKLGRPSQHTLNHSPKGWATFCSSTAQTTDALSSLEQDTKAWEKCKQLLSPFNFSAEEQEKILGKAFGKIHSPYWSEERKVEVPNPENVTEILQYLRSLNLSDEDVCKVLKKFPEVLGCSLENELKNNIQVLEKEWKITGKTLRNLLLRNPKVLGYNVDCKGDCMALCTRCWVRF